MCAKLYKLRCSATINRLPTATEDLEVPPLSLALVRPLSYIECLSINEYVWIEIDISAASGCMAGSYSPRPIRYRGATLRLSMKK